jgi:uncharacterized protein (TIGR01777 family)
MRHYLVTGGTGFIGKRLVQRLTERGDEVTVVTRDSQKAKLAFPKKVTCISLEQVANLVNPVTGVINLAGAPIADKRWSDHRKSVLRDSRIQLTKSLISHLNTAGQKPDVFVSGSAIGFYGPRKDLTPLDESSEVVSGFQHQLCADWEAEALKAKTLLGSRVCRIRTGVVLGDGGALAKMKLPFQLGLGGPMGSGNQAFSWIHLEDEVGIILFLLDQAGLEGAFNMTAPQPVTNEVFSKTLSQTLNRPCVMRVPAFAMELLLGEASELILKGQFVVPKAATEAGYVFQYPDLSSALKEALSTQ